jgi:iron complex outermembrane recepter protein
MSQLEIEKPTTIAREGKSPRRYAIKMIAAGCALALTANPVCFAEPSSNSEGAELAEIVVTVQKKSESAQHAPAAISVVTAEELVDRVVDDSRAFENLIPSAKFGQEGSATQIFMRGVGSHVDTPWVPEAVSLQYDGITMPRYASSISLYDLQRVEALPGPQGTLYGSSSIGGIVNILTNRPTNRYESDALLEYGDFSYKHVTIVENVPVTEDWSIRGAFNAEFRDGYNSNGTDNENALAARLSSVYSPRDSSFSLYLVGNYYYNHFEPSPSQWFPYPGGHAYYFPPTAVSTAFFYPPDGYPLDEARDRIHIYQLAGQLDWDLGVASLSYIPGFVRADTNSLASPRVVGGFPEPQRIGLDQFSNELRLSNSHPAAFTWLAGLFQSYEKSPGYTQFGPNLGGFDATPYQRTAAAFAQGTYSLTDSTRVTVGGRYSHDGLSASNSVAFYPIKPTFAQGDVPIIFNQSWNHFDWKVGAERDLAANTLLYANVQTGFNPGTFQGNLPNPSEEIQPQKMLGYTLGLKNLLFGGRLKFNAEGFVYDYRDQIIQAFDLATGRGYLYNAPRSRITGAQFDTAFAVTKTFNLHANIGYLDGIYTDFTAPAVTGGVVNLDGYSMLYVPSVTAAVGGEETIPLGSGGSLVLRVDSYISSSYWQSFSHTSGLNQPGYTKTDLSFTYHAPDGSWDIGLWGKNLENTAVSTAGGETGSPYPYASAVFVEPPRTFGVRFHWRFIGDTKTHD